MDLAGSVPVRTMLGERSSAYESTIESPVLVLAVERSLDRRFSAWRRSFAVTDVAGVDKRCLNTALPVEDMIWGGLELVDLVRSI